MRFVLLLAATLGACSDGSGFDPDYPMLPPGGGGGGGGPGRRPDAADGPDASSTIVNGKVCVVEDLRNWTACSDPLASGLTVTIGTEMATTTAGGAFSITRLPDTDLQARVTGTDMVPSLTAYDPMVLFLDLVVPTVAHWDDIQANTPIALTGGNGSAIVHVTVDGAAAGAITGDCDPVAGAGVFYSDPVSATVWDTADTDANGKVLCADMPVGPATLTANRVGTTPDSTSLRIQADSITFGTIDLVSVP